MAIKISNVMVEIQITKNIVFLFATIFLKNVTTSLANEGKKKKKKKTSQNKTN
jgi:hypothetical protein